MKKFIPPHFWEFKDVFTCTMFNSLPAYYSFDHQINLDEMFIPQRGKIYALSPQEQCALDEFLEESLSSGQIFWSSSPQVASVFFYPKAEEVNAPGKDPGLHPIQDYQYLNAHVVQDQYPLPLLHEILQAPKLQSAQYFMVIDVQCSDLGR
jgi:hypothetical protein